MCKKQPMSSSSITNAYFINVINASHSNVSLSINNETFPFTEIEDLSSLTMQPQSNNNEK